MDFISIIMSAGKTSVDVALYTLLPIMVVMLIVMKYLEVRGVLDVIVRWLAPLLKPFGLTGMSAFALIQMNFVSFAAPLATLAIMDKRGASDRQMAATLAMLFAMGQGNVFYPLTPFGLHWLASIVISIVGGLCAAAVTWQAMVTDYYPAQKTNRIFAAIMPLVGLSPALAPLLGSWLLVHFEWQAIFEIGRASCRERV